MKKTMKRMTALALALLLALSAAGCGPKDGGNNTAPPSGNTSAPNEANGASGGNSGTNDGTRTEVLTLRVGWPTSGQEGDVVLPGIDAVCNYVTEKSGGMIQFEYFPNQQLGTESDMCDQMILGDLDIGIISNSVAATYWPELYLASLPFAFDSIASYYDLMGMEGHNDGEALKALRTSVERSNQVKLFTAVCCTFRGMQSNRRPITCMDDFKGMTVRVQAGQMYADIYAALGASTASIPFGELYTAMQNGTVDVEDVGIATCYTNRYYEVEDYAVELNHCMCANYFMMSNACYDKLTEEERQWFMEGCVLGEQAGEEAVASGDANAYAEYAKAGVEVIRYDALDPADIQELKDATASVWEKYRDIVGADLYDTFVRLAGEMGLR